jgi:hypothetical protein
MKKTVTRREKRIMAEATETRRQIKDTKDHTWAGIKCSEHSLALGSIAIALDDAIGSKRPLVDTVESLHCNAAEYLVPPLSELEFTRALCELEHFGELVITEEHGTLYCHRTRESGEITNNLEQTL